MDHTPQTTPETTLVDTARVWCDGAGDIRGGENYLPASLGHPRVYMQIDEKGYVDCGYCDRRFILAGGVADTGDVPDVAKPDGAGA
ncbi:zinc-finger domain-containing protein [Aurantiacibacter rhizosphaerae]|uniref:Zinc-finger domain-containing protein n=1 Tax=Aurantiacibacter rhizosphaerae TaxID=2691582 RepID=A0A844XAD3_9SPHN|nr:zinc-finger domain-containing protein [Aurantiacibacter rhizosphaerae]MWV26624.1 zinc-finger domain-containing protein [Aurantiacibacter rhizosphaerae]